MHWYTLFENFLKGEPNAIQAIFSMAGFLATIIGIIYISRSFKQQTHIYRQQLNLNRLAIEKHRREVRPNFLITPIVDDKPGISYNIKLSNAIAVQIVIESFDADGKRLPKLSSKHNAWDVIDEARKMHFDLDVKEVLDKQFILNKLSFKDEDSRVYEQDVVYRKGEIYSTFPRLVQDVPQPRTWGYKIFTNNFKGAQKNQ